MCVTSGIETGCHVEPHDDDSHTHPVEPETRTSDAPTVGARESRLEDGAQDRDEEIALLLEEAKRRGREEPGAVTFLVPSKRIGGAYHKR